jgi:esterase/lipase
MATAAFRNGVVLTHDLLDSPYTMRALAAYFQQRCFLVYGLLLPGHGTQPGDLLRTDWRSWVAAERFAARELAKEVDNLYLAGHGLGGSLAILEASSNADVDGLVLVAPALAPRPASWRAVGATLFGWLAPPARWAEIVPNYSIYRYDSVPYRITAQVDAVVDAVQDALPTRPFEVPVFMIMSMEDATVDTQAIRDYMAARVHPLSASLIFSADTLPPQPPRTGVVSSRLPEVGLLSLSHRALVIPLEDPEFGWEGSSQDCGHYYGVNPEAYAQCMAGESGLAGEITPANLEQGTLERVASNPFYWDLVRVMDVFFAPVAPIPNVQPR